MKESANTFTVANMLRCIVVVSNGMIRTCHTHTSVISIQNTDEYHFIRCGEESGDIEENYSNVCGAVLQFTCPATTIEIY